MRVGFRTAYTFPLPCRTIRRGRRQSFPRSPSVALLLSDLDKHFRGRRTYPFHSDDEGIRPHATHYGWVSAPHRPATSRDLKSSSPSDHFVPTPRGADLVLSPWPVTCHRADRDFRTDNGSARVGFSPLTKSLNIIWSILLISPSNRSFAARNRTGRKVS